MNLKIFDLTCAIAELQYRLDELEMQLEEEIEHDR